MSGVPARDRSRLGRLRTDLRHARAIALTEARRTVRSILASRRQLLGIAFMLVAFSPAVVVLVTGAFAVGSRADGGTTLSVVALARAQVVAWVGTTTVLFGLRAVERAGSVDHPDLLLTTVRPRAVVTGLLLAEFLRVLAVFLPPLSLVVTAFALGADAALMVPVVLVGVLPLFALALLGGFAVGYLLKLGYRRVGSTRLPGTGVGAVAVVVVAFWLHLLVPENPLRLARALTPLGAVPLGPYADLLLVGSPFQVSPGPDAALALVLALGTAGVLLAATWRLAPRVWYADPPADDDEGGRVAVGGVPTLVDGRPTLRLVWWQWLRGLRAPSQFIHLAYFLFMSFPVAQLAVSNPRSPLVPVFLAVLGGLLAGGTFGLNPAGVEGSMLPTVLTSATPARNLVRSRLLAGSLLWVPPVLAVVVLLGGVGSLTAAETVLVAAFAVVFAGFSCAFALAVGLFAPRFETVRAFGGVEAPTPTTIALVGHSLVGGVVGFVGLVPIFLPRLLERLPSAMRLLVQVSGLGLWAAVVGLVGYGCYRYAAGRARTFRYD